MNEEERQRHKARRKNKKKRRDKRKKEEAKQARIEDRRRRLEAHVERAIEERIEHGELLRANADPGDGRAPRQTAKGNTPTTRRKRTANTDHEEIPRKAARLHGLKEIPVSHVTLTRTCLGSGSYGSCYLGTFRGMNIVVKSLHVHEGKGENRQQAENRIRQELIYEARIVNKLGHHPCLPLLFGVCSEAPPFRLILQFHGDKKTHRSLTISSALSKSIMSDKVCWVEIIKKIASALKHVHEAGFLHNDIKCNNVVLDENEGVYNPVLIDFGKSLPLTGLKGPKLMSKERQEAYAKKYPHIAPEIVTGRKGQSIQSDIFSFAKMTETIFDRAKLGTLPEVLNRGLNIDPGCRPQLQHILEALS